MCLSALLPRPASADASPSPIFAALNVETPGLTVLVARHGKVIFQRSAGAADIEQGTSVVPRTRFHVASVSKQFTAAAVLLLARDGKLVLDAPARRYLPSLPEAYSAVTVRQLLNHSSGIRDQWELALASGASISDLLRQNRLLALIEAQRSLNFVPGSEFRYSNSGYLIAAEIVERVSGISFSRFLKDRIFDPLHMRDTLVYDDATLPIAHRAQSYFTDARGRVHLSRLNFSNYGATSIFTTATDLFRWARELLHPTLFDAALPGGMAQATRLTNGSTSPYGLGLNRLTVRGRDAIMHTGSDAGFRALLAVYPQDDATIVILSNGSADVSAIHEDLVDTFLNERPGPNRMTPPPAAELARLTGYYAASWGPGFELALEGGALVRRMAGDAPRNATFHADGTIRFAAPAMRLTRREPGSLWDNPVIGPPLAYRRLVRSRPSPAFLAAMVGRYRSEELDNTISVNLANGRLFLSSQRDPVPKPLEPAEQGAFDTPDARVRFEARGTGQATALLLTMARSRNLRFVRIG